MRNTQNNTTTAAINSRNRALAMTAAKLMNAEQQEERARNRQQQMLSNQSSTAGNVNARNLDSLSTYSSGTRSDMIGSSIRNGSRSNANVRRSMQRNKLQASSSTLSLNSLDHNATTSFENYVEQPQQQHRRQHAHTVMETEYESNLRQRMEKKFRINDNALVQTQKKASSQSNIHLLEDDSRDYGDDNTFANNESFDVFKNDYKGDKDQDETEVKATVTMRYDNYKRLLHDKCGELPRPPSDDTFHKSSNIVRLHIYDLMEPDTLLDMTDTACCRIQLPIGKCFKTMNDGLHCLGTGAYHVGVEVNGVEYAYGMHNMPGITGIFTCAPKQSPGFSYRQTIDFGKVYSTKNLWIEVPAMVPSKNEIMNDGLKTESSSSYRELEIFVEGADIIADMTQEYLGTSYNLLRKNCCHFARDALIRIGVDADEIPSWFTNIAEAGVMTEDAVAAVDTVFVDPIRQMLSGLENDGDFNDATLVSRSSSDLEEEAGFEVVYGKGYKRVVEVGDSVLSVIGAPTIRKAPSWTY